MKIIKKNKKIKQLKRKTSKNLNEGEREREIVEKKKFNDK